MWSTIFLITSAIAHGSWESRASLETHVFGESRKTEKSELDPTQLYLHRVRSRTGVSIYPGLQLEKSDFRFVVRAQGLHRKTNADSTQEKNSADFEEIFASYQKDRIQGVIGLQNFAWGPGESLSPSQYLIRPSPESRSSFYREKGLWGVKLSLTQEQNHFTFFTEQADNRLSRRQLDQNFSSANLIKIERNLSPHGLNSLGLIIGQRETEWMGVYGIFEISEGWSTYFDQRVLKKNTTQKWFENSTTQNLELRPTENENSHLTLVGLRFEDSFDSRVEWIHNSTGWSGADFRSFKKQNELSRWTQLPSLLLSGQDLSSRNSLYLSIRKRDIPRWSFFASDLVSLDDESHLFIYGIDRELGQTSTLILEGSLSSPDSNGMSNFTQPDSYLLGWKAQF